MRLALMVTMLWLNSAARSATVHTLLDAGERFAIHFWCSIDLRLSTATKHNLGRNCSQQPQQLLHAVASKVRRITPFHVYPRSKSGWKRAPYHSHPETKIADHQSSFEISLSSHWKETSLREVNHIHITLLFCIRVGLLKLSHSVGMHDMTQWRPMTMSNPGGQG